MLKNTASPDLKLKFAVIAAAATMGAASILAGAVGNAKIQARETANSQAFSLQRMPFPTQ